MSEGLSISRRLWHYTYKHTDTTIIHTNTRKTHINTHTHIHIPYVLETCFLYIFLITNNKTIYLTALMHFTTDDYIFILVLVRYSHLLWVAWKHSFKIFSNSKAFVFLLEILKTCFPCTTYIVVLCILKCYLYLKKCHRSIVKNVRKL